MMFFSRLYCYTLKNPAACSLLLSLAMLMTAGGCQQSTAGKLQGRWTGKPDTQAARNKREAKKYGDSTSKKRSSLVELIGNAMMLR